MLGARGSVAGEGMDGFWLGSCLGGVPGRGCVPGPMGGSNDVTDVDVAAAATLPLQLPRNGVLCIVHCNIALTLTSSSGQPRKRVPSFGSRYYVEVHTGVLHFSRNGWIGCTDGDRQTVFYFCASPNTHTHTHECCETRQRPETLPESEGPDLSLLSGLILSAAATVAGLGRKCRLQHLDLPR